MTLSTHVLDATTGRPAANVAVTLTAADTPVADGLTDADGRITGLGGELASGIYRLHFDTGAYFAARHVASFYPEVVIAFEITDPSGHYHVPLLLSPYSYSTYRGS
ncbi:MULTISPECIES: hydroxyisourate hydrolase [Mycolicibacterium]|jgi:5-hydroxyisourate hydrolase|uniref:5-hydroxyisourate hydrolase n=1 Tax=Mycolicibacterium vanbaalenii (strain DSM 7251 / JCM 13017 / BCRC 16820 / KCTC 9966 / NRRL B-24157 / PYR-1) TaxID=350058 RepID=A1TFU8_MYCVP|nr:MULTISPECIES: hydroxyisourate hydrolase [Mycolicibacterium]ABM16048.1 Transthyretin [Mycolicibacterium vanbaalenii PYR-1]MCV7129654.1 hydroxyisourate hydrolase [Mycolicibacterium vanbaalenii PYR-1]PQP39819.1 hydroxyisourate hydrolase [Mycolicibacterium austroafricanum]QZT56445.1 hydroxyisourate hydrolase [Mycolicibacterium austroafricanum]